MLNTRVGRFTRGPFLLIDLETKGGGVGRALCFTFIPLAQKLLPPLIEELVASVKGRKIAFAEAPAVHDAGEKRLTHLGHEGLAKMALSMFDMAAPRRAGARGRRAALQAARAARPSRSRPTTAAASASWSPPM